MEIRKWVYSMLAYILSNKEWVFSGLGIALFSGFVSLVRFAKKIILKRRAKAAPPQVIGVGPKANGRLPSKFTVAEPGKEVLSKCIVRTHMDALKKTKAALGGGKILVWLDMDQFTQVNKVFGRACGDKVVDIVLSIILSALSARSMDANVFHAEHRDEFYIVGSPRLLERDNVEKLIDEIKRYDWSGIAPRLFVTCSAGIARYECSPIDTMKRARVSLNYIKSNGGNAVGPEIEFLNPLEPVSLFSS